MIAAQRDTSVSALVKQFLVGLACDESEFERLKRERDDCALSTQVFGEFYVQATRGTRPDHLSHDLAAAFISKWTRFRVQAITQSVVQAALEIKAAHGFSYWDSTIIAAARALGCRELYMGDMAHGRDVDGVLIVNPFR